VRGAPRDDLVQVEVRPLEGAHEAFGFLAARAVDQAGRFAFPAVPPGKYLVRSSWDGGHAQAEVEVKSGVAAWVELAP
jgi:hypothetical protein